MSPLTDILGSTCSVCATPLQGRQRSTCSKKCASARAIRRSVIARRRSLDQIVERFWGKVEVTSGCWTWNGFREKYEYGTFSIDKTTHMLAHRFSYLITHFGIPHDREVMHLCCNNSCVRPDHLELGTHAQNMAMDRGKFRKNTHCAQGHSYADENNLSIRHKPNGGSARRCLQCARDDWKKRTQAKKGVEL